MAGFTVNDGLEYFGNVLYKEATQETYTIGLFVNLPGIITTSSTWASITEPAGSGYAEITLVSGTWVVTGDVITYPIQTWTAGDTWSGGDVQGYYIRNNNASPVLVHAQYRDEGGFSMSSGDLYEVDLSIDSS